jgi:two-component system CheB/CheR fusion protein
MPEKSFLVIDDSEIRLIAEILAEEGEVNFLHYKFNTLKRRIHHRCSIIGCNNINEYIQMLRDSEEERKQMRQDLLISVTSFFRDPEAWSCLATDIIPQILEPIQPGEQIRCWIAACATGEEAYSLAILFDEAINRSGLDVNFTIFATDIDTNALNQASRGIYPSSIIKNITPEHLKRYFLKREENYEISRQLREKIVFAPHNLVRDVGFTRMNLIACRNVLVYLQPKFQQHVLQMFHFSLINKGKLILGKSESLGNLEEEFTPLNKNWNIYEKRRNVCLPFGIRTFYDTLIPNYYNRVSPKEKSKPNIEIMLEIAFKSFLINREMTCFLVSQENKLLYVVEDLANVLQIPKGISTNDITKMVITPLQLPLNTALYRSKRNRQTVIYEGLQIKYDNFSHIIKMAVTYHSHTSMGEDFLMVTIEKEQGEEIDGKTQSLDINTEATQRIIELECDLKHSQTMLQTTLEELENRNQEHQAVCEELIASNEELQSTNEELHSLNAELSTINNEYQLKIQDLTQLTNDIENLLAATNIGVVFLDSQLKIRKFTPAATQVINLLDTDIGRPIAHLSHNLHCHNFMGLLDESLRLQQENKYEVKLKHSDIYLLMRIHPYRIPHVNKFDGLVLTFIDINEIKRTQEKLLNTNLELQRSQSQLQAILDNSPTVIYVKDLEGRYILTNRQSEKLLSLKNDVVIGKTDFELLPQEIASIFWQNDLQVLEQKCSQKFEETLILEDGIHTYISVKFPLVNQNGEIYAICGISTDITERKQTEEALLQSELKLKESEERYALALKATGEGLWYWNLDTNEIYFSPRYEEILGYEHNELTANYQTWISLLHPEDREIVECTINEHLTSGTNTSYKIEFRIRKKDHTYCWVKGTGQALWNEQGEPMRMAGSLQDITERKKAEFELQKLTQALQQLNLELETRVETRTAQLQAANDQLNIANNELARATRLKDEFLANMSHELRTPLNSILGLTEVLQEGIYGLLNQNQLATIETIEKSGNHLLALINDILDLAKIESGNVELVIVPTDIRQLSLSSLAFVKEIAFKKNINLNIDIAAEISTFNLDELRMRQVLINLLSNAVKFTPEDGDVSLQVQLENDNSLVFYVKDNGIGIAPENLNQLFQTFVQIDSSLCRFYEGTGLGLALVKKLVELHQGTVTATSEIDKGSCFVVQIPAIPEVSHLENNPVNTWKAINNSSTSSDLMTNSCLILLAEDNPDNIQVTQDYLTHFGYQLIVAMQGSDVIPMARKEKPQLILMDIQMPELDGLEVIRLIRVDDDQDLANIPIIAVTALTMRGDEERCLAAGANDYLSKPVSLKTLRDKINYWLDLNRK